MQDSTRELRIMRRRGRAQKVFIRQFSHKEDPYAPAHGRRGEAHHSKRQERAKEPLHAKNTPIVSKKNPLSTDFQQLSGLICWDTRTRTKNDRTRICSVTITPYPNDAAIILIASAKVRRFFETSK